MFLGKNKKFLDVELRVVSDVIDTTILETLNIINNKLSPIQAFPVNPCKHINRYKLIGYFKEGISRGPCICDRYTQVVLI